MSEKEVWRLKGNELSGNEAVSGGGGRGAGLVVVCGGW